MKSGNSKQLSESLVISCYKISNNSRYCLCTYTGMHMWDYVWYFAAENICRQVDSKPLYWWFYGDTLSSYLATDGQQAILLVFCMHGDTSAICFWFLKNYQISAFHDYVVSFGIFSLHLRNVKIFDHYHGTPDNSFNFLWLLCIHLCVTFSVQEHLVETYQYENTSQMCVSHLIYQGCPLETSQLCELK